MLKAFAVLSIVVAAILLLLFKRESTGGPAAQLPKQARENVAAQKIVQTPPFIHTSPSTEIPPKNPFTYDTSGNELTADDTLPENHGQTRLGQPSLPASNQRKLEQSPVAGRRFRISPDQGVISGGSITIGSPRTRKPKETLSIISAQ